MTHLASGPSEALATLFSTAGQQDPYPLYESLRAFGPVLALGPQTTLVLGYEECCSALRDPAFLAADAALLRPARPLARSSCRGPAATSVLSDEPDPRRLRQLSEAAYTARQVAELRPAVLRRARQLTRDLTRGDRGSPADLVEAFTFRVAMAVTGGLLGIPEPNLIGLRYAIIAGTTAFDPVSEDGERPAGDEGPEVLTEYLAELVRERRAYPRDDLITAMTRDRDTDGQITEEELVASLVMVLVGGALTADLIGNVVRLALAQPGLARAVAGDPGVAADFVTETLRVDPPVQARTRLAAADVDLGGTPISAGSRLLLVLAAASRDPRRFHAPDRFDITRPGNQPLSFGLGPQDCPAAALARMQAEVAVPQLLRAFPGLTLAAPPRYRDQPMLRGLARLDVILT